MRTWAWMVAATVALSVAAIQTVRLRHHATNALDLAREHRALDAVESAYRNAALRAIRSEFAADSLALGRYPNGAVYMIVDTQCRPSAEAVVALSRGAIAPVVVASYVDAAGRLQEWLRDLGVDLATVPVGAAATSLRHLPRGITPIYLEVDETGPIDIHAGAPKGEWLRQAPDAPVRRVREVLRHGDGVDVPDWAAFVRSPALKLDASGQLYVLPRGGDDPRVRLLDEDGNFVRYVARRGDGPGEFPYIDAMGFADDTLWLLGGERTSFFDVEGAHLKTEPVVPPYPGRQRTYGFGDGWTTPLAGGRALYMAPEPVVDEDTYQRWNVPLMVGERTATGQRDTVAFVLSPSGMYVRRVAKSRWAPVKMSPLHSTIAGGQGVATASWTTDRPGEVVLRRFSLEGEVSHEHVLRFPVRELSAEARERFIDEGVENVRDMWEFHREHFAGVPSDLRAAVVEGLLLPDHYSPVDDMFSAQDARVWLRATMAEGEGGDWHVVDPDGRVEFRVHPPPGVSFETARGNRVWGVGKDRLDTPYIVMYELHQLQ